MADESTAVSTAVSTTPEAKWYAGFDPETQNYLTARGLAEKSPVEAFLEAAKAHREAQAYIGVPKEQLLKLPGADAKPEEWDAVYQRLGYSTDPEAYKLDGIGDDEALKEFARKQAIELKISPEKAAALAAAAKEFRDGAAAATTAQAAEEATRAMEQLRQSWGANFEANKVIADNAYAAIMAAAGFDQPKMTAAIQKLGETAGRAETMQMLLAIGQKLGEDKFVSGSGPSGNLGPRNAEQAKARIAELKGDSTFTQRWLSGGTAEMKEMADLHKLAYGDA